MDGTTQRLDSPSPRLQRLLDYIDADPTNLALIGDAAKRAADDGRYVECDTLLNRYEQLQPLAPALMNLRAVSALSQGRSSEARATFAALLLEHPDDPFLAYNLAYASALLDDYATAVDLLTDPVLDAQPDAIVLRMQCMHHLGMLDAAIDLGKQHAEHAIVGGQVAGMLATLLFDAAEGDQAEAFAMRAPAAAGSLTVLGLLALERDDLGQAMQLFRKAMEADPASGRAHLGEGLGRLAQQDFNTAAMSLDKAAALLPGHAGTWLTSGWAHVLNGDLDTARDRFERALDIDRGFAEALGAIAVTDVYQHRIDDAQRRTQAALRLDRECLSAIMAQGLLLQRAGQTDRSVELRLALLNHPLGGEQGPTIAQIMAKRSLRDAANH